MFPKTVTGWLLCGPRLLIVATWFFSISFVILFLSIFRPFDHRNATRFCRWLSPVALKILGIELEFRRQELAYASRPCVFIGNHQHMLDLFTYSFGLPDDTITVGKQSLRMIPIFGWLYWLSGQILIDRSNNERAVKTMARAREIITRKKLSLLMFPEGTRSRGRAMGPFKKGAFYMAEGTRLPLVPIISTDYFRNLDLGRWRAGKVVLETLEPISVEGKSTEQLLEESRAKMVVGLERLNKSLLS